MVPAPRRTPLAATPSVRPWPHVLAALLALLVLWTGFSRDLRLPGLYMDSINPEYLAVRALVEDARPDTPAYVLPGNLIAGKYPVLAGSYYHGPLQFYVALPVYAVLGTDIVAARVGQFTFGALVLLAMALLLRKARVAPAPAAAALVLLALDPAFMLALKTQGYNIIWPLAWLFLALAVVEHWAGRGRPPAAWQSLLAGLFAGVAFFCYFVFLFFVPALAIHLVGHLRATGVRGWKPALGVVSLHGLGFAIGCAPYLWGYQRAAAATSGWDGFLASSRGTMESLAMQAAPGGTWDNLARTWRMVRRVVDDEWVSRMVLRSSGSDLLGDAKGPVLLFAPLALLLVLRAMKQRSRLLELCVLSVAGYALIGTLAFGTRLSPHHFTLVVPLLYLGIAAGLSAAAPGIRAAAAPARLASRAAILVLTALLVVDALGAQRVFSDRLRRTGGVAYFSETVTTYAEQALADRRPTAYHLPTWGLMMPFVYLTGGREDVRGREPQADRVLALACSGTSTEIAYIPVEGASGYAGRIGAETGLPVSQSVLATRDGRPTIAVVRIEAVADPDGTPACARHRAIAHETRVRDPGMRIRLEPAHADCDGSPRVARLAWDVSSSSPGAVSVWVGDGVDWKLWTRAGASGEASTGPWANAGLRFQVRDADGSEVLATARMGGKPCP